MFRNPFSFSGRIRRLEYGLSFIVYIVGMIIAMSIIMMLSIASKLFLLLAFFLPVIAVWFLYAQAAKRSHDVGYSGWYILIPFYGLYLLFADGDFGPNRYGPNPKGLGNDEEINQIGTGYL